MVFHFLQALGLEDGSCSNFLASTVGCHFRPLSSETSVCKDFGARGCLGEWAEEGSTANSMH